MSNTLSSFVMKAFSLDICLDVRAGDSRSLEGLEMAFYCTAKTVRGGADQT